MGGLHGARQAPPPVPGSERRAASDGPEESDGPEAPARPASTAGTWLFARYAYAPNKLGYCGPARSRTLLDYGAGEASGPTGPTGPTGAELRALARGFHGAWPYLETLAALAGVDDPLDHRVVESYWLGGGIADTVDPREFGAALLDRIRPQAGHYWKHLTAEIIEEAAPNHCFHVLGVYPWSRLLGASGFEQPLNVLDNCRIRWGTVTARDGHHLLVRSRHLTFENGVLGLSEPRLERVTATVDGLGFLADAEPGEQVAVHWDWATDRLTGAQVENLRRSTLGQIEATNRRLARGSASA